MNELRVFERVIPLSKMTSLPSRPNATSESALLLRDFTS
jgi:hypothetical protein